MPDSIQVIVFIAGFFVFIGVFVSLVRRKVNESVGLLWIIAGLAAFVLAIFPNIIERLSNLLSISYPPSLMFMLILCFLLYITFGLSNKAAQQESKIRELAMLVAVLRERVSRLEPPPDPDKPDEKQ